jgi:hypothetical protein
MNELLSDGIGACTAWPHGILTSPAESIKAKYFSHLHDEDDAIGACKHLGLMATWQAN